ncbi:EAL domain-containing protein [Asanoa sp. NPDC050611]|uniref:EAL domain-containing protein n=1 Tax=Asanoa sp. NPDC050611 TaxID=3157098 RepID=UPI0033DDFC74
MVRDPDVLGFDAVLAGELIEPLFQPIVALDDELPVGFEALSRGPKGDLHEAPDLFAAAAAAGRSAELDWLCTRVAGQCFQEADVSDLALFVNVNPETLATGLPSDLARSYAELARERDVVVEITERSLMRQPARLLEAVLDTRRRSARIALDDIGVEPASLAAMPLANPDIIKLDRSVVQRRSGSTTTPHLVEALLEDARRQGTQILAEGIERPEHVAVARSLGATLGQGWLFGRPGPLPRRVRRSARSLARVGPRRVSGLTPFDLLARAGEIRTVSPDMFAEMATQVDDRATGTAGTGILAVIVGDGDYDDEAHNRHAGLPRRGIDVFVLGSRIPGDLGARVHAIPLPDTDPLARERAVLFVGTSDGCGAFARRSAHRGDGSVDAGTCQQPERVSRAMLTLGRRLAT